MKLPAMNPPVLRDRGGRSPAFGRGAGVVPQDDVDTLAICILTGAFDDGPTQRYPSVQEVIDAARRCGAHGGRAVASNNNFVEIYPENPNSRGEFAQTRLIVNRRTSEIQRGDARH